MCYLCSENKGAATAQLICAFVFTYAKHRFSHDPAHFILDSIVTEQSPLLQDTQGANSDPVVTEFIPSHDNGPLREFLNCINPIDIDGWSDKNLFKKIYEIFKVG